MPSRRSLALCSVLVVALLAAVAPTTAAPPPEDVCGACGSQFESAVADAGGSVSVAESALDVQVFENGSARVVVTNRLAGSDGDWVADNSDAVVGALAGRGGGLAPVPADATIQVVDDRVTVTYRSNDVARTTVGGVVLVDAFRDTASSGWTVNADRFRLAAPPGHAVTAGPAATEDGVLTAERGASLPAAFVAFAPDDGAVSTVATGRARHRDGTTVSRERGARTRRASPRARRTPAGSRRARSQGGGAPGRYQRGYCCGAR